MLEERVDQVQQGRKDCTSFVPDEKQHMNVCKHQNDDLRNIYQRALWIDVGKHGLGTCWMRIMQPPKITNMAARWVNIHWLQIFVWIFGLHSLKYATMTCSNRFQDWNKLPDYVRTLGLGHLAWDRVYSSEWFCCMPCMLWSRCSLSSEQTRPCPKARIAHTATYLMRAYSSKLYGSWSMFTERLAYVHASIKYANSEPNCTNIRLYPPLCTWIIRWPRTLTCQSHKDSLAFIIS